MKKQLFLAASFIFIMCLQMGFSQQATPTEEELTFDVQVTHAQFLGKTPPIRNLVPLAGTSQERREYGERSRLTIPNFVGRRIPTGEVDPSALPKGVDPVRQSEFNHSASVPVEPIVDIEGMDQSIANGVNPPDVCGDIGSNYFIQMVNASYFKVFDKEGNSVSSPISTNTIWSQVGQTAAGDPIILYDQEFDRWIITEFPFGNTLLFAVSETNDPMGSWMAYAFATPNFPDYPKYSMWPNAYCVTTNEQGAGTLVNYFINRDEILSGAANPTIQRITMTGVTGGPGFYVSTPVDWTGNTPPPADAKPMILRLDDDAWGSVANDGITVFDVDIDWDNSGNTNVTQQFVATAPFNTAACAAPGAGFACIPQLGGGGIDGLPEVIMHQVHYRNFGSYEVMVLNFLVNADGSPIRAGIRWMELRRTTGTDWEVYQEGTFAPADDIHRFMGGIAMDGNGNIGLGYSISSPDIYPGLGFTGRKSSDPLGEMTIDEFIIADGSSSASTRYGDYAQMSVDPSDDKTFWYTGEYRRPNNWGTRIFSFQLGRDTHDIGPIALVSPVNSADLTNAEPVQIVVKNFGVETQTAFDVGYAFEGGAAVIEPVSFNLQPDSIYVHTFGPTVDMSVVGDYDFTVFTTLTLNEDESPLNDTLRLVRSKLPRWDAGISAIDGLEELSCASELPITIELTNFGMEILTNVTITITLNGNLFQTIPWTGTLAPGANELIQINLTGFVNGANEVIAATSNPNGMVDEVMVNDGFTRPFDALVGGVEVSLLLLTDNYPQETTWELEDEFGNVLFSGGPYGSNGTLFTETWCLDPAVCYEFTIFDSANDGICCGFGQGNYSIVDMDGNTLVESTGEFGSSETLEFCAEFQCMMTADIDISPESIDGAIDGAIMITPQNGVGPYMYSIDGGDSFQASNVFDNLPAGTYDIVVTGDGECLYEETVSLPACGVSFTVVTNAESNSNSNDGSIEITAMNGNGNLSYSIDGGDTFQSNPNFTGLGTGEYVVVVVDELGCAAETVVVVDIETSSKDLFASQHIEVYPNPTMGVFRIKLSGLDRVNPLLPLNIYDANGKLIQSISIARYDGVYTGQVSLVAYTSGTYFVRFLDEKMDRMVRVIKN